MAATQTDEPTLKKPLRLWPGVVAVVLLWLARFGLKAVVPGFTGFARGMVGAIIGTLALLVWWAFFSRAPRVERWGAVVLMIAALYATSLINHESMGPVWLIGYAIPVLSLAFVAWAVASRRLPDGPRRATMVATILLACGAWTLVRTGGINGDHVAEFTWRWAATSEERLAAHADGKPLDSARGEPLAPAAAAVEPTSERLAPDAGDDSETRPEAPRSAPVNCDRRDTRRLARLSGTDA